MNLTPEQAKLVDEASEAMRYPGNLIQLPPPPDPEPVQRLAALRAAEARYHAVFCAALTGVIQHHGSKSDEIIVRRARAIADTAVLELAQPGGEG